MKTQILLFKQAFNSIFNNKARSILTMLGIAIAVFVVVAVDAISNGLAQSTNERFSNLDATRITISSQEVLETTGSEEDEEETVPVNELRQAFGGGQQIAPGTESLTEDDLNDIKSLESVTYASPQLSAQTQIELLDGTMSRITINGVNEEFKDLDELKFDNGIFFQATDVVDADELVVIDYALAEGLFGFSEDAIGEEIELNGTAYTVQAVLAEPDEEKVGFGGGRGGFGGGQRNTAYIPYTTLMKTSEVEEIASIIFEVESEDDVNLAAETALTTIYANHGVTDDNADVSISTAQEALSTISGITESQSKSDKFIGWIVLLVGGIGIMNIMLVTVSERTREIGLRKAIGAKRKHIVSQFLTESVLLTAFGGVFGLLLAILASSQVTEIFEIRGTGPSRGAATDTAAIVDVNTIVIAIAASVIAGIVFGLYPALKASRKDPVESLRYE